jgi:signal transduction histidine kinase
MTETSFSDVLSPVVPCAPGDPVPATSFAPPGRADPDQFQREVLALQGVRLLAEALDALPGMVMVLNDKRQIVAANQPVLQVLQSTVGNVFEKRPGEAVGCIRAAQGPDGCGTSPHCATCGAVDAILQSQARQRKITRECRILVDTPEGVAPLDLRVTATPFAVDEYRFVIAAIEDISQAKRLAVLERMFFHDVLNTAGCLRGYAQWIVDEQTPDQELCARMADLAGQLIEQIQTQRDLIRAESGKLELQPTVLHTRGILDKLRLQYLRQPVAEKRRIQLGDVWEGTVVTDQALLLRVLGSMVKNALEATAPDGSVTIGCQQRPDAVRFFVRNREVMPDDVQLQVFQRSFSTKGQPGRGIGTYSMKVFGERYLGGKVAFESRAPEGTTFRLDLPKTEH